ncbi:PEP-utilizing enzyme [Pyrobaculum ferrireducens]|uniref:PEP-utilizing enzyme n=1 Tax=Pyrobaculum ferrireducens TaxID=1104324 RepID=UPI0013052AF1|nr:PEP-utilizing enzyme [Pyrobaculum ferrireducens]
MASTLSPTWLPALRRSAAIVTESGGSLSHAAILAREAGKPAVVGIRGATEVLRDGVEVEVDEYEGVVRL